MVRRSRCLPADRPGSRRIARGRASRRRRISISPGAAGDGRRRRLHHAKPPNGASRGQRHRFHQRQSRALSRRAEGVPRHPQHQRAAAARRRREALRRLVRGRDAAHRPAERPAGRHARQPGRLRRLAGRAGRADDPLLRPLRRAAGRSAGAVGVAAVRGDDPRRRDLRARIGRRQGPGLHALQGDRSAPEAERQAAGEHEDHPRGRRGSRQRQPRQLHPRPQERARRRRRRHLRLADVRARRAVDLLRPARPRLLPDRPARQQHRPALGIVRRRRGEPRASCCRRSSRR